MAKPIAFKPVPVDFKADLERRLKDAPVEYAAALLSTLNLLEAAHRQGVLDMLQGLIGARDTVAERLTYYAKQPEGIAGIRNLLTAAKILTELDPKVLEHVSNALSSATEEHKREQHPPTLWQLTQRANSEEGRRGLSFVTLMLTSLGRSLGK